MQPGLSFLSAKPLNFYQLTLQASSAKHYHHCIRIRGSVFLHRLTEKKFPTCRSRFTETEPSASERSSRLTGNGWEVETNRFIKLLLTMFEQKPILAEIEAWIGGMAKLGISCGLGFIYRWKIHHDIRYETEGYLRMNFFYHFGDF